MGGRFDEAQDPVQKHWFWTRLSAVRAGRQAPGSKLSATREQGLLRQFVGRCRTNGCLCRVRCYAARPPAGSVFACRGRVLRPPGRHNDSVSAGSSNASR
jgi:hypothetical protein